MAIKINLEKVLKENNMTSKELCKKIGITEANLSILRSGKAKVSDLQPSIKYVTTCTVM